VTKVYVLNGKRINSLDDFYAVVGETMGCGGYFGRNLDAFADCLRGGFGTPEDGDFLVVWRDHRHSRDALSHPEVVRNLERWMRTCHPSHRESMRERIEEARAGRGETAFDWLLEIFENEIPGKLRLE
jgi:RNAse (barnase) inhibitor barstar